MSLIRQIWLLLFGAVLLAFVANTIFKTGMAAALGGRHLLLRLAPFMAVQMIAGLTMVFWTPRAESGLAQLAANDVESAVHERVISLHVR